jgi:hypothetical protein
MSILTLKLLISVLFLASTIVAVLTMFEVLGRKEKRFNTERLTRVHRVNGILFFFIFLALALMGMAYIVLTKEELSPRAALHVMLAHGVLFLFLFKLAVIKMYRQFYARVPTLGMVIALVALGTVASSAGYYVLSRMPVSRVPAQTGAVHQEGGAPQAPSALKGKELFQAQCSRCHDAGSDAAPGSMGMKGILKGPALPATGRPATAENIVLQLRTPHRKMPPFPHLTEAEVNDLIAHMRQL